MCVWIFGGAVGGGRRSFVGLFVCTDGGIGVVLLGLAVVSWPVAGVVGGIWRVVGLAGGHSAGGGAGAGREGR